MAIIYKNVVAKFTSEKFSVQTLTMLRENTLSKTLSSLTHLGGSNFSICTQLLNKTAPYSPTFIPDGTGTSTLGDKRSMLNWRPLTVRLPGYIGGINGQENGVFDRSTDMAIQLCLERGARAFFLDIDYEDATPCKPEIIYRDKLNNKKSLNNGSIKEVTKSLAARAFNSNYDPVLIIVYMRRLPPGVKQLDLFLKNIAAELQPLEDDHLGIGEDGKVYNNCRGESSIFKDNPITAFQKKFIVLTNYDTTQIPKPSNPNDNLDWWTNVRIYSKEGYISNSIGSVTPSPPPAPVPNAYILDVDAILTVADKDIPKVALISSSAFCIIMSPPDYFSTSGLITTTKLKNIMGYRNASNANIGCGIQCVPIDVLSLAVTPEHSASVKNGVTIPSSATATTLINPTDLSDKDPLSFWTYAGWSLAPLNVSN